MTGYTYTNSDILGSSKEPVEQGAHEGGVQAKLDRKLSEFGIGHTLRNDDDTDSQAYGRLLVMHRL